MNLRLADLGKAKKYDRVRFSAAIINSAYERFGSVCGSEVLFATLHLELEQEALDYDNMAEFLGAYPRSGRFVLSCYGNKGGNMNIVGDATSTDVTVKLPLRE